MLNLIKSNIKDKSKSKLEEEKKNQKSIFLLLYGNEITVYTFIIKMP